MSQALHSLFSDIETHYKQSDWQEILTIGRQRGLLGRIYTLCQARKITIPQEIEWHFLSAWLLSEKQKRQVLQELNFLSKIFTPLSFEITLLKGAAYVVHELSCSNGRLFSDIDLLFEQQQIADVELALKLSGWRDSEHDEYDDLYYRQWMHEIPPLHHPERQTVLDIHHNILPRTNKQYFDADRFEYQRVNIIPFSLSVRTLSDEDMFLHSAVHLFTESEFDNGVRDLLDLKYLYEQFSEKNSKFYALLIQRARTLGLDNFLFYAFRYLNKIYGLKTDGFYKSDKVVSQSRLVVLDFCFERVLSANYLVKTTFFDKLARFILYWRGHIIKMPIKILLPHLVRKSYKRFFESINGSSEQKPNL